MIVDVAGRAGAFVERGCGGFVGLSNGVIGGRTAGRLVPVAWGGRVVGKTGLTEVAVLALWVTPGAKPGNVQPASKQARTTRSIFFFTCNLLTINRPNNRS
jgi:hypothetical protein